MPKREPIANIAALPPVLVKVGRERLSVINDNLHRAQMQQQMDPKWKDGNGTPIAKVIAAYQREADALRAALGDPT
jgi:hypothetical protein